MRKFKNAESGQVIVLLALFMIGLLGMVGLAIDGGGLLFLYRDSQNAVDEAARAAGYAKCSNGDITYAAQSAIEQNGFILGSARVVDFQVNAPPLTYEGGDADEFIEIVLETEKPSYFIQLVYREPLRVTVRAVARCQPEYLSAANAVLFAMSTTCSNALSVTGSSGYITGDVFSNTDLKLSSSGTTYDGHGFYTGANQSSEQTVWIPGDGNPIQLADPIPDESPYVLEDYAPGGIYAIQAEAEGLYYPSTESVLWNTNKDGKLEGLYFVDGSGDFSVVGRNLTVGEKGVTIVSTGTISLSADDITLEPYSGDLLLFSTAVSNCGNNSITLSSSNTIWSGMIYANNGGVRFSDSGNSTTAGGIVAQTIQISASNTNLTRDPVEGPWIPPAISLAE